MKNMKSFEGLSKPNYGYYWLRNNPFRPVPVSVEEPTILVDRDEVWNEIQRLVRRTLLSPHDAETYIMLGGYGIGKTHLLKYVRSAINITLRSDREAPGIAAYVTPGKSMYDFYVSLVSDLGEDVLSDMSARILERFPQTPQNIRDTGQMVLFGKQIANPSIVEIWQGLQVAERDSTHFDFFSAALNLLDELKRDKSIYWLQGGNLSPSERIKIGVQTISTKDNAVESIVDFVGLLKIAGYKNVYILLDELEKVSLISPDRARTQYFDQLRELYDQLTQGFSLFAACTPDGWDFIEKYYQAFRSRAQGQFPPHSLAPFNADEAIELAKDHLKEERLSIADSRDKRYEEIVDEIRTEITRLNVDLDPELFPFSKDVITEIQKKMGGNVRDILRVCGALIEKGYDEHLVFIDPSDSLALAGMLE